MKIYFELKFDVTVEFIILWLDILAFVNRFQLDIKCQNLYLLYKKEIMLSVW